MALQEGIWQAIEEALSAGDSARCQDLVRSALRLHPNEPMLWVWMTRAQRMGGQFEEAVGSAEHALECVQSADAVRPGLELELAFTCFEWARGCGEPRLFDRAKVHLQRVLASDPAPVLWESASVVLAACDNRLGDPDRAISRYRTILSRNPHNEDALYNLAVLLDRRAPAEAEQLLRTVCRLDPAHAGGAASVALCEELCLGDRCHEAEAVARAFFAAAPNDHRAMTLLADTIAPYKPQEAIELLQTVLAEEPASWRALQTLGGLRLCLGETQAAERLLRRAVECGAMNAFVVEMLVKLLSREHRLDEALEIALLFRSKRPDLESSHEILARVYLMNQDLEPALQESTKAVEIDPVDPDCLLTHASVLVKMGDAVRAEAIAKRLEGVAPEYSAKLRKLLG